MILRLSDNTELIVTNASEYYRRGDRRFETNIREKMTLQEVKDLFSETNMKTMTLIDDNQKEVVLTGYKSILSITIDYDDVDLLESNLKIILTEAEL